MVYRDNFIVAVKHKGKILREFKNNMIRLPFGSDYTILLKNKDFLRKVLVNIKIDGVDVLDGNGIIVSPNSSTELKGFMKGARVRNKFRFIERTKEISNYRGNRLEDGLIEVEYVFEKYELPTVWYQHTNVVNEFDRPYNPTCYGSSMKGTGGDLRASCCVNDTGITVPGKVTRQDFVVGDIGPLEATKRNIIIQLKGKTKSNSRKKIKKAVTVKTRIRCSTCGRRWKSSMQYCGNCSTYLH